MIYWETGLRKLHTEWAENTWTYEKSIKKSELNRLMKIFLNEMNKEGQVKYGGVRNILTN